MFGGLTGVKLITSLITLIWAISLCAIKVKKTYCYETVHKFMCRKMSHKLMYCQIGNLGNKLIYREVSHNFMSCPMDHKLSNVERNEGLLLQNC